MINPKSISLLLIASFLIALAVNFFIAGYNLTPGGITGLAISMSILTNLSVSTASLIITIPLLLIGAKVLGQSYGLKTLIVILSMPLFMAILPMNMVITNVLLSGIIGGIFVGLGISIAIYDQCSTGGTDLIAMVLNKLVPRMKISSWLLLVDGIIVLSSAILTGEIKLALYSFISLLTINVTIRILLKLWKVE